MAMMLIVDDDRTVLDVLYELFSGDHLCHTASTAEEALATMALCDYDIIVTDLTMPGLSGEDLLGFAKTHCPGTPVLFISGSTDEERARRLLAKGAFDYLQKPFQLPEVYEKVACALEHRRRRAAGP
jgi:DNA-binding NtrC family response regulator